MKVFAILSLLALAAEGRLTCTQNGTGDKDCVCNGEVCPEQHFCIDNDRCNYSLLDCRASILGEECVAKSGGDNMCAGLERWSCVADAVIVGLCKSGKCMEFDGEQPIALPPLPRGPRIVGGGALLASTALAGVSFTSPSKVACDGSSGIGGIAPGCSEKGKCINGACDWSNQVACKLGRRHSHYCWGKCSKDGKCVAP